MKIRTSELAGAALDWAVAKCEGIETAKFKESPNLFFGGGFDKYAPSTNWAQGGPIIEREKMALAMYEDFWLATMGELSMAHIDDTEAYGPTPLIAAMRCYVASKLGEEIDIPEELQ